MFYVPRPMHRSTTMKSRSSNNCHRWHNTVNKLINRLHVVTRGVTVWELLSVPPRCLPLRRRRPRSSESRLRIGSIRDLAPRLVSFPSFFFFFSFFLFSFLPSFSLSFGSFLPLFLFIRSYNGEFWEISRFLMRHRWKEKERKEIFNFGKISLASSVAILVLWLQLSVISDHVQFCFNADENRNNSFYIYFSFFWVKWFEKKYEIR